MEITVGFTWVYCGLPWAGDLFPLVLCFQHLATYGARRCLRPSTPSHCPAQRFCHVTVFSVHPHLVGAFN